MWNKVVANEKFFKEEANKRVNESKRPPESKSSASLENITGTFKKLEID